jgi:hypothetical protein
MTLDTAPIAPKVEVNNPNWNPIQKLAVEINRGSKKTMSPEAACMLLVGTATATSAGELAAGVPAELLFSGMYPVVAGITDFTSKKEVPISSTVGPVIAQKLWEVGCQIEFAKDKSDWVQSIQSE